MKSGAAEGCIERITNNIIYLKRSSRRGVIRYKSWDRLWERKGQESVCTKLSDEAKKADQPTVWIDLTLDSNSVSLLPVLSPAISFKRLEYKNFIF